MALAVGAARTVEGVGFRAGGKLRVSPVDAAEASHTSGAGAARPRGCSIRE